MKEKSNTGTAVIQNDTPNRKRRPRVASESSKHLNDVNSNQQIVDTTPNLQKLESLDATNNLQYISGIPNLRFIHDALRHLAYTNFQAICDIIDNSIDALVNTVKPFIKVITDFDKNGKGTITIVDNGKGMTHEVLSQALVLGSETGKNHDDELGCYGSGLNTASLSLGRGFKIITKSENNKHLCGYFDIDVMKKIGTWDFIVVGEAEDYDINQFNELTNNSETGTVVQIYNLDKISNCDLTSFNDALVKEIGTIFRYFLSENGQKRGSDGKIQFTLNGKKIERIDPMYRNLIGKGVILMNKGQEKQKYTFNYNHHGGKKEIDSIVKYFFVGNEIKALDEFKKSNSKDRISGRGNGFYVMRNNRQIMAAEKLGFDLDKSGGHFSNFRIELSFDGEYDDVFKLDVKKTSIELPQALRDAMQKDYDDYKARADDERTIRSPKKVITSQEKEKQLKAIENAKNKALNTPTLLTDKNGVPIEKEEVPDVSKSGDETTETKKRKPRKPEVEPRQTKVRRKLELEYVNLGENGNFFTAHHLGGGKFLFRFNVDHIYYERIQHWNIADMDAFVDFIHSFVLGARSEMTLDAINALIDAWSYFLRRDMNAN